MKAHTKTPTKTDAHIEIGLTEDQRRGVAEILTHVLADEYVLYTKTRNYHWNVVGLQFLTLHKFFEDQYTQLNESIDEVAERTRALGHYAMGTLAEFLEHTRLQEQPGQYPTAGEMVANLVADHETVIRCLRDDLEACMDTYHDVGTSDFLLQLMETHEKTAWMLRAFLEGESV
jgi:starvation-inducible DNA-binding protein